jgi:hypothetical protein
MSELCAQASDAGLRWRHPRKVRSSRSASRPSHCVFELHPSSVRRPAHHFLCDRRNADGNRLWKSGSMFLLVRSLIGLIEHEAIRAATKQNWGTSSIAWEQTSGSALLGR